MLDNGYLFANDNKRLFINSSLGCSGACSYCYLPKFKYDNQNEVEKVLSANEIIELIDKSGYKILPTTLITIGCFSECMDRQNKKSTLDLIKYFLKKGNQVQISTKQFISYEDIKDIIPLIKYYGQFIIFVSSTTISQQGIYERNTTNVEKRFKNFELTNFKIPVVLYLKPILKDVTIKDISMYKSYIKKYAVY